MTITLLGSTFDASNAQLVAAFWAEALGRPLADGADETFAVVQPAPAVPGSRIGFRQVPEGKSVKNRMHFDFATADFDTEVDRLIALGATKLTEVQGGLHYATLADPEGNEFDVIDR